MSTASSNQDSLADHKLVRRGISYIAGTRAEMPLTCRLRLAATTKARENKQWIARESSTVAKLIRKTHKSISRSVRPRASRVRSLDDPLKTR